MPVAIMKPSKDWDNVLDASTRREDPEVETVRGWDAACESGQSGTFTVTVKQHPTAAKDSETGQKCGLWYDKWDGV
jgi:hypothetical protein